MSTLTNNRHEPALHEKVLRNSGSTPPDGMRDLLRDTALLVTTLRAGGEVENANALRDRCGQLIKHLSEALERRGYQDDVRREALIAQCGLLDETVLLSLSTPMRDGWELKPLQVEQFNLHDAGESVFDRLKARMRESSPRVDLLQWYSAVLAMGFLGRYAREGQAKRDALTATLNAQLQKLHPSPERPFVVDRAGRTLSDWFYRLSPWAIAGLACAAATIVWLICTAALDLQLAHLVPAKGIHP